MDNIGEPTFFININIEKSLKWHLEQHQLYIKSDGKNGIRFRLDSANLQNAVLWGCNLRECYVMNCDFSQTTFEDCYYDTTLFKSVKLYNTKFINCIINNISIDYEE